MMTGAADSTLAVPSSAVSAEARGARITKHSSVDDGGIGWAELLSLFFFLLATTTQVTLELSPPPTVAVGAAPSAGYNAAPPAWMRGTVTRRGCADAR